MKVIFSGAIFTWLTIFTIISVLSNSPHQMGWLCFTTAAGITLFRSIDKINKNT